MDEILNLVWITFLPFLELRASIPYGILKTDLDWIIVFVTCVFTNMVLGAFLFPLIDTITKIATKVGFIEKVYRVYVERTQRSIDKYVDRYGEIGVAIFIGVPLPGSGVYSGALAAYLIGLGYRRFIIAEIMGVLIAGVIVTIVSLSGEGLSSMFVKML